MAVDHAWKRGLHYDAPFFIFCDPLTPHSLGRFINGVAGGSVAVNADLKFWLEEGDQ